MELEGLGDAARGEWREWSGQAFHLRRRLSEREQESVGQVLDIRQSPEAYRRVRAVPRRILERVPPEILAEEVGRAG